VIRDVFNGVIVNVHKYTFVVVVVVVVVVLIVKCCRRVSLLMECAFELVRSIALHDQQIRLQKYSPPI
jgi:hypothetical protein